jgi:hypothetical protein
MRYAMRMVQTHYATVAEAAAICGVNEAALQAHVASLVAADRLSGSDKVSYGLERHIPGAY